MARPKNADGQRTRQAILDAALDLFAEKGFFGTSLRDVAAAVGVRESALYNYFTSKDALFEALILADQHTKIEQLAATADGPIADARTALEEIALASLNRFRDPRHEKLFRILMSDGIRLARTGRINLFERMGGGHERLQALMRRLIREGWLREQDPQLLALGFSSLLLMWRQLHAINADLPMIRNPRKFVRQHIDQFLQGAAAPPPATRPARPRRSSKKSQGARA
ncbi:MAG: TetR/AcrR family transcriptional regulator [Vicinamibacterales bacterium]